MLEKIGKRIDSVMEIVIAILFVLMVIAGGFQVFNRFMLNQSLSWSEEFQKFCHIWIVFLTIPIAYNRGSHIGMEVLLAKLPFRIQKIFSVFFDLLWFVLAISVAYYSIVIMEVAQFQTSAGLGIRMDWVYSGLVVGGLYLLIVSIRKLSVQFGLSNSPGRGL